MCRSLLLLALILILPFPLVAQEAGQVEEPPLVRNPQLGVATHFQYSDERHWGDPATIVPLIAALGVTWVRDDVPWNTVEKEKGVYQIPEKTLNWINAVHNAGLKPIVVFNYDNKLYDNPYDPQAYAAAAAYVAKTLAGKIDAIEVENEPHNFGWLKVFGGKWNGYEEDGTIDSWVGKYVEFLNTAAPAIHAANPAIKVIGLGSTPPVNFRQIAMGISSQVDGITDHPYSPRSVPERVPYPNSPAILKRDGIITADEKGTFSSQIRMYRDQLKQYNGPKEIWLTEFGFTTFSEAKGGNLFEGVTRSAQAKYLLRRLAEIAGLSIDVAVIYDFKDDGTDPYGQEDNYGLLDFNLHPKPAYNAVRRFASIMAAYKPSPFPVKISAVAGRPDTHPIEWDEATLSTDGKVLSYQFANEAEKQMALLWCTERADGDLSPLLGTVDLAPSGDVSAVSKVTAYDFLTGESHPIPFTNKNGHLILKKCVLPDSPVMLTWE